MTSNKTHLRYIGGLPISLVFPTRTVEVKPGDEVELLPIEVERLAGREDFISAADQAQASTPVSDPDPDADPDSEEIS